MGQFGLVTFQFYNFPFHGIFHCRKLARRAFILALPKSYLTSTKNLSAILQAIQSAQAPERFNVRFLENLGFTSSNDRLIVGVLKELGFLDGEGKPTSRYFRFLDASQASHVLAEGIREAYADLFALRRDANKMSREELTNKAKTLSQGSLSESVLEKFAMTFSSLVKHANFDDLGRLAQEEKQPDQMDEPQRDLPKGDEAVGDPPKHRPPSKRHSLDLGGLHYNFQIILPATRDPAVYDAIFRSLKEHLIE